MKTKLVFSILVMLFALSACSKDEIDTLKGSEWVSEAMNIKETNSIEVIGLKFEASTYELMYVRRPDVIQEHLIEDNNTLSLNSGGIYSYDPEKKEGVLGASTTSIPFVIQGAALKIKYEEKDFILYRKK